MTPFNITLLTAERDELQRRLNVEQQLVNELEAEREKEQELTHEAMVKLALCQQELEQYKAAVLLADPAVAAELNAHGVDVVEGVAV